ncbi:leucine-rich repeat protein [Ruminococcus sp.]|uniref:leucine-rich repeat protein n=1 Tax=Ruminococcus sp. TaxID=41978 RepID=UPI0025CEFAE6|nr:leucine-rich repeat protein [Ruminococcus sp.]MBR1430318.1 leucine-rich repeat protein [Ruminococcus sp.]
MKIKRIIAAVMAVAVVGVNYGTAGYQYGSGSSAFAADTASAEKEDTVEVDGIIFEAVEGGYSLVKIASSTKDLVIPDEVNGYPVVSVREDLSMDSKHMDDIESVKLGKNVRIINDHAFTDCSKLTSLELNDVLEYVGECAFTNALIETPLAFPETIKTIGDNAFSRSQRIPSVTIPNPHCVLGEGFVKMTSIIGYKGSTAEKYVNNSQKMHLTFCDIDNENTPRDNFEKDGLFYTVDNGGYCLDNIRSDMTDLLIPDEVNGYPVVSVAKNLSMNSKYMDSIESVKLGKNVKVIGEGAFQCNKLESIELNDALEWIDKYAFSSSNQISELVIPSNVSHIGDGAFTFGSISKVTVLSPDCVLGKSCLYAKEIVGYKGSTAEAYAEKNGLAFTEIQSVSEKLGDANCDGNVELADAIFIMQVLSNPNRYTITDLGRANADVDKSTVGLTANDALFIQEYLLHLRPSLEPET